MAGATEAPFGSPLRHWPLSDFGRSVSLDGYIQYKLLLLRNLRSVVGKSLIQVDKHA